MTSFPLTLAQALLGVAPDIVDEVQKLAAALLAHDVTARALLSPRRFVELPLFHLDEDGAVVEGKIDLLFEEDRGYVLVDWKTDRVDTPEDLHLRERLHASQLAAYEQGLRAVLGPSVRIKEKHVIFARR